MGVRKLCGVCKSLGVGKFWGERKKSSEYSIELTYNVKKNNVDTYGNLVFKKVDIWVISPCVLHSHIFHVPLSTNFRLQIFS